MPSARRFKQILKQILRKWKARSLRRDEPSSHTLDRESETKREQKNRAIFQTLPQELKQHTASFLSPVELERLVGTSEILEDSLDLERTSSPLTDRASREKWFNTNGTKQCFAIVFANPEAKRIHSMAFTAFFTLLGGEYATLYVVENELPTDQDPDSLKRQGSFDRTNVIATKDVFHGIASMGFPAKPDKMYLFYVRTFSRRECGVDSELAVEDMTLTRLGFGAHSTQCTSYQYEVKVPPSSISDLSDDDSYESDLEWMEYIDSMDDA